VTEGSFYKGIVLSLKEALPDLLIAGSGSLINQEIWLVMFTKKSSLALLGRPVWGKGDRVSTSGKASCCW
jgi:hypothetical protein